MEKIREWLDAEHADFEAGLALYLKHGRNPHIKQYLVRKRDMRKLRYELGKFVPKSATIQVPAPVVTEDPEADAVEVSKPHQRLQVIREGGVTFADLPDVLKGDYQKAVECYQAMRSAHEKMKLATTDPDRVALRQELTLLDDVRRQCWERIDRWGATGELPEVAGDLGTGKEQAIGYRTVGAARLSVSRNLEKLERESDPAKAGELREKIGKAISVITAAGGGFDKLSDRLKAQGLLQ